MSPLTARSVSMSSTDTAATSIPFIRRRMSAEQVQALHNLFELKSHPSKQERADLARELNLELKVVNIWFQNKRRSMKKKSIAWNRATALMSENAFGMGSRFSTLANPSKQKSFLRQNSSISLDSIASFREKKEAVDHCRPPLTPRKNTLSNASVFTPRSKSTINGDENRCLWEHLPSSPPLPPSSPTKETELLSTLPPQSRTRKSLEWACAKDRVGRRTQTRKVLEGVREEEDMEVPELDLDSILGDDTDVDDEMITPDHSVSMTSISALGRAGSLETKGGTDDDTPAEDVEAAMALLGFKVRSS
ncbi:hypothetical protein BC835DRAFT_1260591 [Cytidiella melzeri]|nr:hypothetical protein BC835DRAFT_1260591 [Cytidiella melzeri]